MDLLINLSLEKSQDVICVRMGAIGLTMAIEGASWYQ